MSNLTSLNSPSMIASILNRVPPPPKDCDCVGCGLQKIGGSTMLRHEGKGLNKVALLGEAAGDHEQKDGLPFRPHAQAGSVLERVLRRKGWTRDQFVIFNMVNCRPPANELVGASYEQSAIEHCRPKVDRLIDRFKPKAIVALGNTPTSQLTGLSGKKLGITSIRGFVIPSTRYFQSPDSFTSPIPVIPTYHPSYIARGSGAKGGGEIGPHKLLGVMMRDIQLAVNIARNGYKKPEQDYRINPPREYVEGEIRWLREHPEVPVFSDIETIESLKNEHEGDNEKIDRITQFQFSYRKGHSVVYPWGDFYIDLTRDLLSLPNPKVGFNWWEFDYPILRAHDCTINGVQEDTMYLWHFWQPDLPRGLQYSSSFYIIGAMPWKHLSASEPGYYGGCDSDYNLQTHYGILGDLRANGMEDTYRRHIVKLHEILVTTSNRGVPMSQEKLDKFGDHLNAIRKENYDKMQPLVPKEILQVHPENGYVREIDAEDTKCKLCSGTGQKKKSFCLACGGSGRATLERRQFIAEIPEELTCPHCGGIGKTVKQSEPRKPGKEPIARLVKCPTCKGRVGTNGVTVIKGEKTRTVVERQCQVLPFNPSSGDQVLDYLHFVYNPKAEEWRQKHPKRSEGDNPFNIPKDFEDGDKETTGKEELKRFGKKTGDPLIPFRLAYTEAEKLKGTYVEGWQPGEDGNVHCTFKFTPATGQLAAVGPNILTTPKQGDLGKDFRDCIEARPGHSIIEADFGAFHAKTLALCARDPVYYRLASLDVHSYLTCHMLKLPEAERMIEWEDKHFIEFVSEHRKSPQHYALDTKSGLWYPSGEGKTFEWIRNFKAKRAILGIGFGMGVGKLFNQNQESFVNRADAQGLRNLLEAIIPAIFTFQKDICNLAYRQGYLKSLYNYVRYFWDIQHWDVKKRCMVNGEDTEACIAFLPANHAHAHFRDTILRMDEKGYMEKYNFIIPYHDAIYFHCPDELVEEAIFHVKEEMTRPNPILAVDTICPEGFSCCVDIKVGKTMKNMKGFDE